MKKIREFILILVFAFAHISVHASGENPSVQRAQQLMRNMMKNILVDNENFRNNPLHDEAYFRNQSKGQDPRITIVGCADSRVHTSNFDFHPLGDVFFIRNIGNQIESCEGSIEYGMRHKKTPLLLILGHSKCGAVQAVTEGTGSLEKSIQNELCPMRLKHYTANPNDQQIEENVGYNVHNQVNKACEKYNDLIAKGVVWVVGAVYDFTPEGRGEIKVIQVNERTEESYISTFLDDVRRNGDYCNDPGRLEPCIDQASNF